MSFTAGNPGDPLPWAEATGHAPPEDGEGIVAPPPPAPAPAVCAPGGANPCVTCEITSETVMTEPADRGRRNIGVGERVTLTFSLGNATWTGPEETLSSNSGASVVFTAPDTARTVTITATGSGCTASITLTIIAPTAVRMRRIETIHVAGTNGIGMNTRIYLLPDNVNFHRVGCVEDEIAGSANGVYICLDGRGHFPSTDITPCTTRVAQGLGTQVSLPDHIRSGTCVATQNAPGDGQFTHRIPWRYKVRGFPARRRFTTVTQQCTSAASGQLQASKARATATANLSDPTMGTW